jgi:hypothetical protein
MLWFLDSNVLIRLPDRPDPLPLNVADFARYSGITARHPQDA